MQGLVPCLRRFLLRACVTDLMNQHFPKWAVIDAAISETLRLLVFSHFILVLSLVHILHLPSASHDSQHGLVRCIAVLSRIGQSSHLAYATESQDHWVQARRAGS